MNIKTQNHKTPKKKQEVKLPDTSVLVMIYLNLTEKVKSTKTKINKRDYIKLKVPAQQRKPSATRKGKLMKENI